MLAWVIRYLMFAYGDGDTRLFMLVTGIVLHGICYDFFFVSGQIYTDSKAGVAHQSAAQGLITLATYGVGMLIGFQAAGLITDKFVVEGGHDWQGIWIYPAIFAAAVFVLFLLAFKNEKISYKGEEI
jgi:MFS family permease